MSFNPHKSPTRQAPLSSHFTDTQLGGLTSPGRASLTHPPTRAHGLGDFTEDSKVQLPRPNTKREYCSSEDFHDLKNEKSIFPPKKKKKLYLSEISPTLSQKEEISVCNGLHSQQQFYQTKKKYPYSVPHYILEVRLSTYNLGRIYMNYLIQKVGIPLQVIRNKKNVQSLEIVLIVCSRGQI